MEARVGAEARNAMTVESRVSPDWGRLGARGVMVIQIQIQLTVDSPKYSTEYS